MTHVITGATGFVGSALVLELLLRTEEQIIGIVRPKDDRSPTERLHDVLMPLVRGYGLPDSVAGKIKTRVRAVAGDLEEAGCGVLGTAAMAGADFWHCAASLKYQDRHKDEIERSNVGGTAHVLQLAAVIEARRFYMISTAYVAGSRSGLIAATKSARRVVNNLYEDSKVVAEHLVRTSGLRHCILRPGVVVGHSKTRHTTSSDGLYGFVRSLRKFRGVLDRTQPGLADRLQVQIIADAEGTLDLVPVDHVAADAVALSLADAPQGHYHLTNGTPPDIGVAVSTAFAVAGLQPPTFVSNSDTFTAIDRKLKERLDFYNSYIINPKRFDRSTVRAAIGDRAAPGLEMDAGVLTDFCQTYLDSFEAARSRLPVAR